MAPDCSRAARHRQPSRQGHGQGHSTRFSAACYIWLIFARKAQGMRWRAGYGRRVLAFLFILSCRNLGDVLVIAVAAFVMAPQEASAQVTSQQRRAHLPARAPNAAR